MKIKNERLLRFKKKCRRITSVKQTGGFRNCSSIAHRTVACRIFASYSNDCEVPVAVPRVRSYPGSLK